MKINLIQCTAAMTFLLNACLLAAADTRIIGEFEYSLDDNELSEWEIGPAFSLYDSTNSELDLEVLVGQDDRMWFIQPELIYETGFDDLNVEFTVGIEASLNGEDAEAFGSVEGSVDF